jgi:hypothetical protein
MLYNFEILLVGFVLLLPLVVFGVAWARSNRFYSSHSVLKRQKVFYRTALVASSVSALTYLGYWSWRACSLYGITLPFTVLVVLERFLYLSRFLSASAVACFLFGRGPHRFLAATTSLWVTLQIWLHNGIIHWA